MATITALGSPQTPATSQHPHQWLGVSAIELLIYPHLGEPLLPCVGRVTSHAARTLAAAIIGHLAECGSPATLPRAIISSELATMPYDLLFALSVLRPSQARALTGGCQDTSSWVGPSENDTQNNEAWTQLSGQQVPRRLFSAFSPLLHAAIALISLRCHSVACATEALEALPPRLLIQLAGAHPYLLATAGQMQLRNGTQSMQTTAVDGTRATRRRFIWPEVQRPTGLAIILTVYAPHVLCDCFRNLVCAGRLEPTTAASVVRKAAIASSTAEAWAGRVCRAEELELGVLYTWLLDTAAHWVTFTHYLHLCDRGTSMRKSGGLEAVVACQLQKTRNMQQGAKHVAISDSLQSAPATAQRSVSGIATFARCAYKCVDACTTTGTHASGGHPALRLSISASAPALPRYPPAGPGGGGTSQLVTLTPPAYGAAAVGIVGTAQSRIGPRLAQPSRDSSHSWGMRPPDFAPPSMPPPPPSIAREWVAKQKGMDADFAARAAAVERAGSVRIPWLETSYTSKPACTNFISAKPVPAPPRGRHTGAASGVPWIDERQQPRQPLLADAAREVAAAALASARSRPFR